MKAAHVVPVFKILTWVCLAGWLSSSYPRADAQEMPRILAATPPMGWNSWNFYGDHVSQEDILAAADEIASGGLGKAGYQYVVIDDGWQGTRKADGTLTPNERFPDMPGLAAEIHRRGLRFGLYSSPGPTTCAGHPGSAGHEIQDARMFAAWGVDFLKYDVCSLRATLASEIQGDPDALKKSLTGAFSRMADALKATGRPILFSISAHGLAEGWEWAPQAGAQMWRTGDDVHPTYVSIAEIGFQQAGLSRYAHPGAWNDPDMLEIGNGKLTLDEQKTQMSLWAILAAPLFAGNNLAQMTPETKAILTNPIVIGIDQDALGMQGERVRASGPVETWSRQLHQGIALGLFNRNAGACWVPIPSDFHLPTKPIATDVWSGQRLNHIAPRQRFLVPPHGVVLLLIRSSEQQNRR